jgi:hypothetical protein
MLTGNDLLIAVQKYSSIDERNSHTHKHPMELNKKQLSFIYACIEQWEGYEFETSNGHKLTASEVDEVISMIEQERG